MIVIPRILPAAPLLIGGGNGFDPAKVIRSHRPNLLVEGYSGNRVNFFASFGTGYWATFICIANSV